VVTGDGDLLRARICAWRGPEGWHGRLRDFRVRGGGDVAVEEAGGDGDGVNRLSGCAGDRAGIGRRSRSGRASIGSVVDRRASRGIRHRDGH